MRRLMVQTDSPGLRVLAVGAHPDDIELGCAAALLQARADYGDLLDLTYVLFTGGAVRRKEALCAAELLGAQRIHLFEHPDSRLPDHWSQVKDELEALRAQVPVPDLIFCPRRDDEHQDHRVVAENVWRIFRDHLILEYELAKYEGDLSPTNFFIPVSADMARKKVDLLFRAFPSGAAKHHWFTEESFMAILRLRGIECNERYAEGFHARKVLGHL